MTQYSDRTAAAPPDVHYDVDTTNVVTPTDRVRWASVLAGLFTAMAALIVLTVLGIAIGLEAYDAGDPGRNFGIGTGIYSIISGLIAFFLGGFMAARTAAVGGRSNGVLNGALVWIVTIVLIVNFLGAGIGTLLGTTANVVGDAAGAVVNAVPEAIDEAGEAAESIGADTTAVQATAVDAGQAIATQAADTAQQIQEVVSPQNIEQASEVGADVAWMVLLALGLSALAAVLGGIFGARPFVYRTEVR